MILLEGRGGRELKEPDMLSVQCESVRSTAGALPTNDWKDACGVRDDGAEAAVRKEDEGVDSLEST